MLWLCLILGFVTSLLGFNDNGSYWALKWDLTTIHQSHLKFVGVFDAASLVFAGTVCFIAWNVMTFSKDYMPKDSLLFNTLVSCFVFSMMLLAFSGNLLSLSVGWDGLGLTSYLLVVYYPKSDALAAGTLTVLSNRVGDAVLMISMALMCGLWDWDSMWVASNGFTVCLLVTACTKSAQFPFCSWLPAAMAAPTPVSSLVHSSTLVTAGVFLLIRSFDKLSASPIFCLMCVVLGFVTMAIASLAAVLAVDLKKVVALSTLSQLGFMVWTLGLGNCTGALFHLLSHALFKALLFVSVGYMILLTNHNQDARRGGPNNNLMCVSSCFMIANLALMGTPFMGGFYSKDFILEDLMSIPFGVIMVFWGLASVTLTSAYTMVLLHNALMKPSLSPCFSSLCEGNIFYTKPLLFLAVGAVTGGACLSWVLFEPMVLADLKVGYKMAPSLMIVASGGIVWYTSRRCWGGAKSGVLKLDSQSLGFLVPLLNQPLAGVGLTSSAKLCTKFDQGWLEWVLGSPAFWEVHFGGVLWAGDLTRRSSLVLMLAHMLCLVLLCFMI